MVIINISHRKSYSNYRVDINENMEYITTVSEDQGRIKLLLQYLQREENEPL